MIELTLMYCIHSRALKIIQDHKIIGEVPRQDIFHVFWLAESDFDVQFCSVRFFLIYQIQRAKIHRKYLVWFNETPPIILWSCVIESQIDASLLKKYELR